MGTLELQNLTYSYDKKKKVLRGIDARMEAGKIYAILGPSGCGKTTLLSLLGGLDSPTSGAKKADTHTFVSVYFHFTGANVNIPSPLFCFQYNSKRQIIPIELPG